MRVIYNRFFPFGSYHGINLFGTVFVQRRWGQMRPHELRHEYIHTLQQWELTYVGFYLWYVGEYLVRLLQCRLDSERAYFSISLEREAYAHEHQTDYPRCRRPFAWTHYLHSPQKGRKTAGEPKKNA